MPTSSLLVSCAVLRDSLTGLVLVVLTLDVLHELLSACLSTLSTGLQVFRSAMRFFWSSPHVLLLCRLLLAKLFLTRCGSTLSRCGCTRTSCRSALSVFAVIVNHPPHRCFLCTAVLVSPALPRRRLFGFVRCLFGLPSPASPLCECVSLGPRAPNSHHLCYVRPWLRQGLALSRRAAPRVSSARSFTCCSFSAGLTSTTLLSLRALRVGGR